LEQSAVDTACIVCTAQQGLYNAQGICRSVCQSHHSPVAGLLLSTVWWEIWIDSGGAPAWRTAENVGSDTLPAGVRSCRVHSVVAMYLQLSVEGELLKHLLNCVGTVVVNKQNAGSVVAASWQRYAKLRTVDTQTHTYTVTIKTTTFLFLE